jgi:acyl carrier protein
MRNVSATDVEAAVLSAVDRLKEVLPPNVQLDRGRGALLLGDGTSLDSMAVVNLLVFVEEEMLSALGIQITLAGADGDGDIDPEELESIGTLVDAICARVHVT